MGPGFTIEVLAREGSLRVVIFTEVRAGAEICQRNRGCGVMIQGRLRSGIREKEGGGRGPRSSVLRQRELQAECLVMGCRRVGRGPRAELLGDIRAVPVDWEGESPGRQARLQRESTLAITP